MQILGLLWQVIKIRSLNMINIKDHPDIIGKFTYIRLALPNYDLFSVKEIR